MLTGVLFVTVGMDANAWGGYGVRFVLWVVVPLAFIVGLFDDNPAEPPPGR